MGGKKLKAIVVKGTERGVKVAQPERIRELIRYYRGLNVMVQEKSEQNQEKNFVIV